MGRPVLYRICAIRLLTFGWRGCIINRAIGSLARGDYTTLPQICQPLIKKILHKKKSPSGATRVGRFPISEKLRTFSQKLQKGPRKRRGLLSFLFFYRLVRGFCRETPMNPKRGGTVRKVKKRGGVTVQKPWQDSTSDKLTPQVLALFLSPSRTC